jgi:hypothetical protein
MISTPLSELDLTDTRSALDELRLLRVRELVRAGVYRAPADLIAEAILASSLVGIPPNPAALAWAC